MTLLDLLVTAIALSMDAFAVSVSKGLSVGKIRPKHWLITGTYFGGFQALMPLIGYALARSFSSYIERFAPIVACVLLAFLGINMLREAFGNDDDDDVNDSFTFRTMLPLAVATSIDALAAGVSFSCVGIPWDKLFFTIACIGMITFMFSAVGVKIGNVFGTKYQKKAEIVGGLILILMGLKILVEYLLKIFGKA